MKRVNRIGVCVIVLLLEAAPVFAGETFDFSFFRFRTGISDSSGPSVVNDVSSIDAPQNPINTLQDTGIGNSYSRTNLDLAWTGYSGVFNTAINQHIEATDFLTSFRIDLDFTADIDLLLTVDMDIDYSSPPGQLARVSDSFVVGTAITNQTVIRRSFDGGAGALSPPTGNFSVNEQILLPAGEGYEINLSIRVDSVSVMPPMNAPIDIFGHMNFSLTPVPEPHTALLLLCAVPFAIARRRPWRKL